MKILHHLGNLEERIESNSNYTLSDPNAIKQKVICPKYSGYMIRREGKFGQFYGCSNYPFYESTLKVKS